MSSSDEPGLHQAWGDTTPPHPQKLTPGGTPDVCFEPG